MILASASPVRARLLAATGLEFTVIAAEIDERTIKAAVRRDRGSAVDCALALAEAKAQHISAQHPRVLVIGADQVLVCGGAWFDKPHDLTAARDQLCALRGREHELATAVCAVCDGERLWSEISRPRLAIRTFSEAFLDDYLAAEGGETLGSVGGYRLEGRGIQLFSQIDGDYFAILGLPLLGLLAFLRDRGAICR